MADFPPEVCAAIDESSCCFLATCADGVPNVVPVGFKWVVGDQLLIADLFFGKTRRNLASNTSVAVTVAAIDPKRGFQLKGSAKIHMRGEVYDRVRELLQEAGVDADPFAAVAIEPTEVYRLDPGPDAGARIT